MYTGIYVDNGDFLAQNCIMAKTTVRPRNPHFFNFIMSAAVLDGISIPKAFMKDYLEGEKCEGRKATLRTLKGGKSWVINTKGCCFTDGWEDFAREHDLHVGDLLVFRYEGGFTFNVIIFDATMCERLYPPLDSDAANDNDQILKEKNDANGYP
ncbi:B3 domain-containing protein rem10-like, partial [Thalictrum thalictroides]